jgi:hypothetical protein
MHEKGWKTALSSNLGPHQAWHEGKAFNVLNNLSNSMCMQQKPIASLNSII